MSTCELRFPNPKLLIAVRTPTQFVLCVNPAHLQAFKFEPEAPGSQARLAVFLSGHDHPVTFIGEGAEVLLAGIMGEHQTRSAPGSELWAAVIAASSRGLAAADIYGVVDAALQGKPVDVVDPVSDTPF